LLAAAALTRRLSVPVTVALARTTLPAGDWARARRGDAVLFDGSAAVKAGAAAAAYVACGDFEAPSELTATGQVYLREGFHERVGRARRAVSHNGRETMSATADESEIATSVTVLAAAPLEVVAEIGRAELRADELLGLRPGAVLPFGPLGTTGIELRVGDRLWARGELVDVDGQLGVRITELTPAPEGAPAAAAVVSPEEAITRRF
jgi:type III secretion system YscQ/HrcQ family protein